MHLAAFERCLTLCAAENPGASIGDVAKAVAELWRNLSEEDKKPYQVDSSDVHVISRHGVS